jgi:trimeric autotransporter adhesin
MVGNVKISSMFRRVIVSSLGFLLLAASSSLAIDVPTEGAAAPEKLKEALGQLNFQRYDVQPKPVQPDPGFAVEDRLETGPAFESEGAGDWRVQLDSRTGAPLVIEGDGIPLLPGTGNRLEATAFVEGGKRAGERLTLDDVAAAAAGFVAENKDFFKVDPQNLILDESASRAFGKDNENWTLRYNYVYRDANLGLVPVREAFFFVRVNQGNMTQFGNQLAVRLEEIDTEVSLSRQAAVEKALDLVGDPQAPIILDPAADIGQQDRSLQIVPVNTPDGSLRHQLVRSIIIETDDLSVEFWFDAKSGDLVNAINHLFQLDATVRGGIFPSTNTDTEVAQPLPFIDVDNDGTPRTSDLAGVYDHDPADSNARAALEGTFVAIRDQCGASDLSSSDAAKGIDFGQGPGADCDTPGHGGNGNTHAARSAYFHLNMIKEKARQYLNSPGLVTPWLDQQLIANVNINQTCNASFSGGSGQLRFFRSGNGCSNTGEITAVFLHEFGHGLDSRTNGTPGENGSGEAFGDVIAFLQTHDSCIGPNFRPNKPCQFGCDASCTGVRDVAVTPAVSPATIDEEPARCDLLRGVGNVACPFIHPASGFPYEGPMGYEGHCESLIASGAIWDMVQGFSARYGEMTGWAMVDRLWHESIYDMGSAYQITSGGKCNQDAAIDGCGANNWYTALLVHDDDNGDLSDGTPNAGIIWDAFNAHGIACGDRPAEASQCPTLGAPALTVVPDSGQVGLDWEQVSGAEGYRVYRNSFSCDRGLVPIGEAAPAMTDFDDTMVANGTEYFYAVQAIGADDACVSPLSQCQSATPSSP